MAPPVAARREPQTAAQKSAERMSEENAALKREAIGQEERLKRMHAKVQKMEQDMAGLLRKRGTGGQGAAVSVAKGARDQEVERLETAIHDRQFHVDSINKQLLIIKHTAPGATRKPLSSIYGAVHGLKSSAYGAQAPAKRPKSAAGGKKETSTALLDDTSEGDFREIVIALRCECNNASERLRVAQKELETQQHAKGGAEQRDKAIEGKSRDELRSAVHDLKSKTTMIKAAEEQCVVSLKNAKDAVDRTEPIVNRLREELADGQRELVDLTHRKKVMEVRKGEHDELSEIIKLLRVEQGELEEENKILRNVAFSADEVIVHVTQLGDEQQELSEENQRSKKLLDELSTHNVASEKALAELESDSINSISKLQMREKDHSATAKLLTREIGNLREKLSTFIGGDWSSGDKMDQGSVREARLLAHRMGVPMYMRSGAGEDEQSLDNLRREIRRLKVKNASEQREIDKLRQMVHTQEHLMRHTVSGGAAGEGEKEIARIRRLHHNKVAALQRRISEVANKNQRLSQLLAQSRVDQIDNTRPSTESHAVSAPMHDTLGDVTLQHEQLVAGRGVVSVCLDGLVLNRDFADFSRNEPTTLLVLDFYLHDTQHSAPMRGIAPDDALRRDLEVSLDDLFLHFLYYDRYCM